MFSIQYTGRYSKLNLVFNQYISWLWEYTQKRNPSSRKSYDTWWIPSFLKNTIRRCHLNVICMISLLVLIKVNLHIIGKCTVGKSHLNVIIVIKLLFLIVVLHLIRSHTLSRSHVNMMSDKSLLKKFILFVITEHTMVRSYINVTSIIKKHINVFLYFNC